EGRGGKGTCRGGWKQIGGKVRRRMAAARHQTSPRGGGDEKDSQTSYSRQHKGGRVGEGDLGIADFDDRKQIDNLKLVDWIDSHDYSSFNCLSRTTPAARITFSTPAAKPSSRSTG